MLPAVNVAYGTSDALINNPKKLLSIFLLMEMMMPLVVVLCRDVCLACSTVACGIDAS